MSVAHFMKYLKEQLCPNAIVVLGIFFLGISLGATPASAHPFDYGAITTDLAVSGTTITLTTTTPQNISFDSSYQTATQFFQQYLSSKFVIKEQGQSCPFTVGSLDLNGTTGQFICPVPISSLQDLTITSTAFEEYFQNFDHFVSITIADKEWDLIFTPSQETYPTTVSARYLGGPLAAFSAIAQQFVWLGMLHIWTGYDHILFLLSIVLLARSIKKIAVVVTAFTLAHSVTLILASFHIIEISSQIIEPLIALSIMYVAYRNIRRLRAPGAPDDTTERWLTAFGFGLIHGLGFAGALTATHIPSRFFVPALVLFNGGIEIGQFAIVLMAVPLLRGLDRLPERRTILLVIASLIGMVALYWFVERLI